MRQFIPALIQNELKAMIVVLKGVERNMENNKAVLGGIFDKIVFALFANALMNTHHSRMIT